jgi:hypothetical protein
LLRGRSTMVGWKPSELITPLVPLSSHRLSRSPSCGMKWPPNEARQVTYSNALAVYGLNGEMKEEHWLDPSLIDQRTLFEGNSILRGGQTPRIEEPRRDMGELRIA